MKAVLIISHGSRSQKTLGEIRKLVKKLKARTKIPIVEYAFLEIEFPSIHQGVENCIQNGADDVRILLNFLNAGQHVDKDIPKIIARSKKQHPKVRISISKPIGQHSKIVDLFSDLI